MQVFLVALLEKNKNMHHQYEIIFHITLMAGLLMCHVHIPPSSGEPVLLGSFAIIT